MRKQSLHGLFKVPGVELKVSKGVLGVPRLYEKKIDEDEDLKEHMSNKCPTNSGAASNEASQRHTSDSHWK